MRCSIENFRSCLQGLALAGAAALLLALAPPTWAGELVDGAGALEVKNSTSMTLQVDETLIQVTDDTDIFNADSQRISFAQIPDPRQIPVDVTYEGRWSGDGITATRLLVRPLPQ